jgi:hypothetical protein
MAFEVEPIEQLPSLVLPRRKSESFNGIWEICT